MVGRVRFKGSAPAGTTITLRFAEVLDEEGEFYTANLRTARATDYYTFKGEGVEIWEPKFTFHGFRYVELSGYPGELEDDTITGVVLHSEMAQTGHFSASEPILNQLQSNILWGQKGNFVDVPTDCPQRDERLGWTGDIQVFAAHRRLQHGRGRLPDQVGAGCGRCPERARRSARGRAQRHPRIARRRPGLGGRRHHLPVDDLPLLRRHAHPRSQLHRHDALHGLPAGDQPRLHPLRARL